MEHYVKTHITTGHLSASVDLCPSICALSYFKTCQIRDRPQCEHRALYVLCLLRVHNLLSFPPAINLNKSLQIPLLTLPFCVSACVLQNHNIRENDSVNMSFCRISRCTSTLWFLTPHDTLIPSPAPPCTVNTLHCSGLSETMEVGQRAEGCG